MMLEQEGWLAVPFRSQAGGERIVCKRGERLLLQAWPQVPLRGPYRLAITSGFHVEELLFGLLSQFVADCGPIPSEFFKGEADPADPKPWQLLPLEGSSLYPGLVVTLSVRNVLRVDLFCEPVLWASKVPDSRRYRAPFGASEERHERADELERERRRIHERERAYEKNVEACAAELERRERALREERERFNVEKAEQARRHEAEQQRREREQLERDPAWRSRETDREQTELARARAVESRSEVEGAWQTACDES